jgi:hypothetical protein
MTEMFRTIDNNKNKKFNHPTPYDLADSYDGIPEIKLKYEKTDFCPCGSGNLYLNCKNKSNSKLKLNIIFKKIKFKCK